MDVIRCSKGHFFDKDKDGVNCPFCSQTIWEAREESPHLNLSVNSSGNDSLGDIPQKYSDLGKVSVCKKGIHETVYTITPDPVPGYVLKVKEYRSSETRKSSVLKEAEIMRLLKGCRHIVRIQDCSAFGGKVYFLEDYSESFSEYIKKRKMRNRDVLDLAEHITLALIECRDNGVYHLNVQPANIFVDQKGIYRLGDFSSSEFSTSILDGRLKKQPMRGAIAYIAPEVFIGRKYSEKSEMYSLGLVLYEILNSMKQPFMDVFGKEEAYSQRLSGTPLPEPKNGPRSMQDFVMKVCAYNAEMRFSSYEDLLEAVRHSREILSKEVLEAILPEETTEWFETPFNPADTEKTMPQSDIPTDVDYYYHDKIGILKEAKPEISSVQFTALAPRRIAKGEYVQIDIVMYEEGYRNIVDRLIKQAGESVQQKESGFVDVMKNTRVSIELTSPEIAFDDSTEEAVWKGKYLEFNFAVLIPEGFSKKEILFFAKVYFDGMIATKIKFVVKCSSLWKQKISMTSREDILSAFVSYASADRKRVAMIVQGMEKARHDVHFFFDVDSLRSGDIWENALWDEIDHCDIFYLCWSRAAKESSWVEKEWRYALDRKGLEKIEPIPIDPPDVCPPPEELKGKHFNDRLLYLINK